MHAINQKSRLVKATKEYNELKNNFKQFTNHIKAII